MKKCSICGEEKPLEEFYRNRTRPDGRGDKCKPCGRRYQTTHYWANPEAGRNTVARSKKKRAETVRTYNRNYLRKNPDKSRKWNSQNRERNLAAHLLNGARGRARTRGVPFSITKMDIAVPSTCPILGIPLKLGEEHSQPYSPSLDAIIPELGYVPGNIAVISHKANTIKSNASAAELRAVADWLDKQTLHPPLAPSI